VVHGVTNTGDRYRRLALEELPGVRVVAPDLRGHGYSTWDPPWTVDAHVQDLRDTLDALGLERATVAGHSFGGLIAARLAGTDPGRVERLVLLDPAIAIDPARAEREAQTAREDRGFADVDEARRIRLALRPPHARDTVEEDLITRLAREPDGRVRFRVSREAWAAAYEEMALPAPSLAAYPGPVTLVPAERSDILRDEVRAALRRELGERLTERPIDAGHVLVWDAREELGAVLREALGR
jgi:lipase